MAIRHFYIEPTFKYENMRCASSLLPASVLHILLDTCVHLVLVIGLPVRIMTEWSIAYMVWQTDRQTDRQTYRVQCSRGYDMGCCV